MDYEILFDSVGDLSHRHAAVHKVANTINWNIQNIQVLVVVLDVVYENMQSDTMIHDNKAI